MDQSNQQSPLYSPLFTLQEQFEPLHDRLIAYNSVQVDCVNTIYVATQKRIYVVSLKRLTAEQDWIHDIIHLKEILDLKDSKSKYQSKSTDPITSAFNLEKKDRVSQIDFLKFAVTEQGIPMIHSSLIAQRLRGLNNDSDLLGFRSLRTHPIDPGVLAIVLNNGDAYIYKKNENLIIINTLISNLFQQANKKFKQITSISFSEAIVLDRPLSQPHVVLAVCAETYLYLIILPEMIALEKIELDAENVHEQLILRVEYRAQGIGPIILNCVVLVSSGKVYSITLKLSPEDLSSLSCEVSSMEIQGCLGVHWWVGGHILLQQGLELFDSNPQNLKSCFPIATLPSLSKLIRVFPQQQMLIMQNGEGLVIHDMIISLFKQSELFSISGTAQTSSSQILIIGGQPDVTLQKKGAFALLTYKTTPLLVLANILRSLKDIVTITNGNMVIPLRPINLDDIVLLMQHRQFDRLDILKSCFALYDHSSFFEYVNLDKDGRSLHLDEAKQLAHIFEGVKPELQQYCVSVGLLQLLLLGKKDIQGWEQIYLRCYKRFLEYLEENIKIACTRVKLPRFITQRLEYIHSALCDQLHLISCRIKGGEEFKPLNHNQYKYFNSQVSLRAQTEALTKLDWEQSGQFQPHKCPVCQVSLERKDWTVCVNQHRFFRCDLTLEPLNEQRIIKCRTCKFQYGEVIGLPLQIFFIQKFVCPLCCGQCKYFL